MSKAGLFLQIVQWGTIKQAIHLSCWSIQEWSVLRQTLQMFILLRLQGSRQLPVPSDLCWLSETCKGDMFNYLWSSPTRRCMHTKDILTQCTPTNALMPVKLTMQVQSPDVYVSMSSTNKMCLQGIKPLNPIQPVLPWTNWIIEFTQFF